MRQKRTYVKRSVVEEEAAVVARGGSRWSDGRHDFLFLLGSACFLQIGDESILKRSAAALLDELRGRADGEHLWVAGDETTIPIGRPIAIGASDFRFMGGSMGSVFGEKVTRLLERARTLDVAKNAMPSATKAGPSAQSATKCVARPTMRNVSRWPRKRSQE